MTDSLLSLCGLSVWFPVGDRLFGRKPMLHAVEGVDLELRAGEALGIVGESGCGKSTLARAVLQLVRPTHGQVVWMGRRIESLPLAELRPLRRDLQIVFQDPLASLNPRLTIGEIVAEPLRVHRPELDAAGRKREVADILGLFVSHNLAVVRRLCERVLVLYLGRTMELALTDELYERPLHPYTRGLLAAVPIPDPDLQPARLGTSLGGELPSPLSPPSGCVFRTRCPYAAPQCEREVPVFKAIEADRRVACLRWHELPPESGFGAQR